MIAQSSYKFAGLHLFLASAFFSAAAGFTKLSRAVSGSRGYATHGLEQLESFRRESERRHHPRAGGCDGVLRHARRGLRVHQH